MMGDLVEIKTWPIDDNFLCSSPYYRQNQFCVTSCGVTFAVMADGNALVGLARKPGKHVDYWVGIDHNTSWIYSFYHNQRSSAQVQNVISPAQYTKFWLQWDANCIKLGRYGEQSPIVSYSDKLPVLKYITFGVLSNPGYWKIDLPPVRPKLKLNKQITGGKLTWVEVDDQLPDEALIGGFENECLYIIRAPHSGSLTPGKFVPSEGRGYFSWGRVSLRKGEFEVLRGFDCSWVSTRKDRIPLGAVIGGYSSTHAIIYVGRAKHKGHVIPGSVLPSHKACSIIYKGKIFYKRKFEILVEPTEFPDKYLSNSDFIESSEEDYPNGNRSDTDSSNSGSDVLYDDDEGAVGPE